MKRDTLQDLPPFCGETHDALYGGRLRLRQPITGFRFAVDAPLLTAFAAAGKHARLACDLGTGCGVIALGLAWCGAAQKVVGIELQAQLAALARLSAADNDLSQQVEILEQDLRHCRGDSLTGRFDLVVANPPYWPVSEGHLPEDASRRIAGFEVEGTLGDWLACGKRLLSSRGRMCLVYPCRRIDVLLGAVVESGLGVTRLRFVHPVEGRPAELVLAEVRLGKPGRAEVLAPLSLLTAQGQDTPEAATILSGQFVVSIS